MNLHGGRAALLFLGHPVQYGQQSRASLLLPATQCIREQQVGGLNVFGRKGLVCLGLPMRCEWQSRASVLPPATHVKVVKQSTKLETMASAWVIVQQVSHSRSDGTCMLEGLLWCACVTQCSANCKAVLYGFHLQHTLRLSSRARSWRL
jgi:hypothetical protein